MKKKNIKIDALLNKLKKNNIETPRKKLINSKFKNNRNIEKQEEQLKVIGITGSRGKSSIAYIVHQYLKSLGYKSVLYSSITIDSPLSITEENTAVENPIRDEKMILDAILESVEYDADYLIMEVNERAISKGYTKDIPFDIRILTNIIPKQNDIFYPDYVNIKKTFFKEADENTHFIMELIDKDCIDLYKELKNKKIDTISTEYLAQTRGLKKNEIDYLVKPKNEMYDTINGINMSIEIKNKSSDFHTKMIMPYTGLNIACAISIINALGVYEKEQFSKIIEDMTIPGRDEVIRVNNRIIIISVNMVPQLENLKRYQGRNEINKIIVVTGATGLGYISWVKEFDDETYEKDRIESVKFAYNYLKENCDYLYITTSDSGATDKKELLNRQENLIKGSIPYSVIENRYEAIEEAIKNSKENDVIFISGRGNRKVMCDSKTHISLFVDKEEVEKIIENILVSR